MLVAVKWKPGQPSISNSKLKTASSMSKFTMSILPSANRMPRSVVDLDPLCGYCERISQRLVAQNSEVVQMQHHNHQALLEAAGNCALCSLITRNLHRCGHGTVLIQWSVSRDLRINVEYYQTSQSGAYTGPFKDDIFLELFRDRATPVPSEHKIFGRSTFEDPAEAVTRVALPWMLDCQNGHINCRQPDQEQLPSRVLDVGKDGDGIALREIGLTRGKYTALSHCWGGERPLTTTVASITQHMDEIPYSTLPATFRDAVRITRLLGINYLWIDSLCIIQDNFSDWEHESAKMHEYYKNSFVTIAASDSNNSFAGMLHRREIAYVQLPGLENVFVRRKIPTARYVYEHSVLESRAWCLQERLLSTRVLHMARSDILFECRTGHQRESSIQIGDSVAMKEFYRFGPDRLKRELDDLEADPQSAEKAPELWYNLVQQYSQRSLTNPNDMLPAILGVAEQMKNYTGLTYMYGLWKEDMARGLLWSNDLRGHNKESQQSGAPSWSWAAMTGYVKCWPKIHQSLLVDSKLGWGISERSDRELILHTRSVHVCLDACSPHRLPYVQQQWDVARIHHIYYNEVDNSEGYAELVPGARVGWMIADVEMHHSNLNECKALEIVQANVDHLDERDLGSDEDNEPNNTVSANVLFLIVVPHPAIVDCWMRVGVGMSGDADCFDDAYLTKATEPNLIFAGRDRQSIRLR